MQLSNITTASFVQVKSFVRANNIVPTGDLRRRDTWENAAKAFLTAAQDVAQETVEGAIECIRETLTYDNAVLAANTANVLVRRSLRFFGSAILVAIALVCVAIETWQTREEVKTMMISLYRRQVSRVKDRWVVLRERGNALLWWHVTERVQSRVIRPTINYRQQILGKVCAATR